MQLEPIPWIILFLPLLATALIVLFTMAASAFSVRDFWEWVELRGDVEEMNESLP